MKQYSTSTLRQLRTDLRRIKQERYKLPTHLRSIFNCKSIDSALDSIEEELKRRTEAEWNSIKSQIILYKKVRCNI